MSATPREELFAAAGKDMDDVEFGAALDLYRDRLLAAAPSMDPPYCPYDCDRCHHDTCNCVDCADMRERLGL